MTVAARRASRIEGMQVSDIVQIKLRAAMLRDAGRDVIDLSIGEPDFATPAHILEEAAAAMTRGETHYTATAGTARLRAAVVAKLAHDNGRTIGPGEVFVGVGAKQVIAAAFMATLEPGDEVIVPAPYWSNYVDMVRIAGGEAVVLPTDAAGGFRITPDQLASAIGPRTRWLMLNSPSNPTGALYDGASLAGLAEVIAVHPPLMLLEDAIYEHLIYDGQPYVSLLDVAPGLASRHLWVNGVSKAYAMTGWRIGYGVAPAWLIEAMTVVAAQQTSHPCSIAQAAAAAALEGPQEPRRAFRAAFARRRDIIADALAAVPGVVLSRPAGAFYAFPDVSALIGDGDDRALGERLLDETGVALVPGSAFGAPGHLRLSYAASEEALAEAGRRLAAALT